MLTHTHLFDIVADDSFGQLVVDACADGVMLYGPSCVVRLLSDGSPYDRLYKALWPPRSM